MVSGGGEPPYRPSADQVRTICAALRASRGEGAHAFASQQMGVARGDALAIWLAVLRHLRA